MVVVVFRRRSEDIVLMVLDFTCLVILQTSYNCLIITKLELKEKGYLTYDIGVVVEVWFLRPGDLILMVLVSQV